MNVKGSARSADGLGDGLGNVLLNKSGASEISGSNGDNELTFVTALTPEAFVPMPFPTNCVALDLLVFLDGSKTEIPVCAVSGSNVADNGIAVGTSGSEEPSSSRTARLMPHFPQLSG